MESKRLNVVLFSTQWPEYMVELANSLCVYADISLIYPTNHRWSERHRLLLDSNVNFIPYKIILYKSLRKNFLMIWDIYIKIKILKPNIIHIQANGHRWFWLLYILLLPFKIKFVNTIHDPTYHSGDKVSLKISDKWSKFFGKLWTNKYIVHGTSLIKELSKSYHIKENRIVSIPHGHFDIYKRFQKNHSNENGNRVLFFGRIWPYKGLNFFIKSSEEVIKIIPDVKFVIAGTGENIDEYLKLIKYPESFEIHNRRIDLEEAGKFFEECSFVVLPYTEATQSGVIPVAYAYKKPVISTKVGAIPEVVIHNQTGLLIEAKNIYQLSEAIIFLLQNPKQKERLGNNAYLFAMDRLNWKNIAQITFQTYQSLVFKNSILIYLMGMLINIYL